MAKCTKYFLFFTVDLMVFYELYGMPTAFSEFPFPGCCVRRRLLDLHNRKLNHIELEVRPFICDYRTNIVGNYWEKGTPVRYFVGKCRFWAAVGEKVSSTILRTKSL